MKSLKLIATTLLLALFTQVSFAQDKLEQKATEMVKVMNAKLSDATKLTNEQEKQLLQLYVEKIKQIKSVRKEITDEVLQKEKVKEINKEYGKKIHETILNKEQKAALKEYRKNNKEE
jgi:hypothetical protein